MNYKEIKGYLIAVDLDNTIITGFDNKDLESFQVLKELAKNNYIIIATGRPWRSSCGFYNWLELNTPIINYNGAYVHHPKDPNFKEIMITIENKKVKEFVHKAKDYLINIFCENKDDIYLLNDTDKILPYLHQEGSNLIIGDYDEILNCDTNGAILFTKPGSEELLEKFIHEVYHDEIRLRHWFTLDTLVSEFYSPETSKANALEVIRKYYNIPKSKTIAIGDGHNDIEMLDYAHIGVAMEDSHNELLPHATFITKNVTEHGVKYFFENYDFKE
jgi:hypothetical protein